MKKWLILLAAVPLAVLLGDQLLARAAAEPDRFAADLTMKQGRAAATGEAVDWLPERHFRVERERTRRGWTSTLRTTDTGTGNGDEIVGIVDGGDDEAAQLIDNKGRRRPVPAAGDVRALLGRQTPPSKAPSSLLPRRFVMNPPPQRDEVVVGMRRQAGDWLASLMHSSADRDKRGRGLRNALGQSRGRVRGFEQYVAAEGDRRREVLVDPVHQVPVEMTVGVGGELESRIQFSYQGDVQGNLVRTGMRTERIDREDKTRRRSVLDVQMTNVRLPKGGVR